MSKKIRYSLIAFGFLIFLVLAPFLVMYVGGWVYDKPTKKFVKTGILAIKTDPADAQIEVDGKTSFSTSGNIKFLRPEEYKLKISKDGYFSWEKKLPVFQNHVTWASPAGGKIFLLKTTGENKILAEKVLDFWQNSNSLVFLQKNNLTFLDKNGKLTKEWKLTDPAQKLLVSPDGKTFILLPENPKNSTALIPDSQNEIMYLKNLGADVKFQFSPDNSVYFLKQKNLFVLNKPFQVEKKIASSVLSFSFSNKTLYYIDTNRLGKANFYAADMDGKNSEILAEDLPFFQTSQIFSNFEKEIFLLLDTTMFKVNGQNLEKLASDVSFWQTQSQNSSIVFSRGGEINFYNPFKKTIDFVSRSSEQISFPILNMEINYAFASVNNKIQALELDTRNRQNIFELYSGKQISKFTVSSDNKEMFVLDEGILKKISIR